MDDESWANGYARSLMVFLNGDAIPEPDTRGQRIVDDSFLVLFNGHDESLRFTLPDEDYGESWLVDIDTGAQDVDPELEFTPGVGGDGTGAQCGGAPLPPGAAGHVPGGCRRDGVGERYAAPPPPAPAGSGAAGPELDVPAPDPARLHLRRRR